MIAPEVENFFYLAAGGGRKNVEEFEIVGEQMSLGVSE